MSKHKLGTPERFMEDMLDYCNIMSQHQKSYWEQRTRNNKAWEIAEQKVSAKQGNYRTKAYNTFYAFSKAGSPIGNELYDELVNGLTKIERKAILGS